MSWIHYLETGMLIMPDLNKHIISKKKSYGSGKNNPGLRSAVIRLSSRDKVIDNSGVSREDIRKLISYLETL